MKIITLGIDEIIPYDKNPRINDHAVEGVRKSIEEFGFLVPIIVDKNNIIVAGHTRHKALKELGKKEVECIRADDLTEAQIEAFRLVDNKVHEYSYWDYEKLEEEVNEIAAAGVSKDLLGFSDFEIENLGNDFNADRFTVEEFEEFEDMGEWEGLKSTTFTIVCENKEEQDWFREFIGERGKIRRSYFISRIIEGEI